MSLLSSAKVVENAVAAKTIIGTIGWMPPEVQKKTECFSFAILICFDSSFSGIC